MRILQQRANMSLRLTQPSMRVQGAVCHLFAPSCGPDHVSFGLSADSTSNADLRPQLSLSWLPRTLETENGQDAVMLMMTHHHRMPNTSILLLMLRAFGREPLEMHHEKAPLPCTKTAEKSRATQSLKAPNPRKPKKSTPNAKP